MTPRIPPCLIAIAAAAPLALAACVGANPAPPAPHAQRIPLIAPSAAARQCLFDLGQTQANFTPLPDQNFGAGCSTINTVRLAWLRGDDAHLQLANLGPVTCPLANAMQGWARYGVDRAARQILGSPLARIDTFGSYACRNVAGTDRRSGHASANAVDIAGFELVDGRKVTVKDQWSAGSAVERQFLRTVQQSACRRFSLVLTPEYNAAHRDHLHLEVGAPHPICH